MAPANGWRGVGSPSARRGPETAAGPGRRRLGDRGADPAGPVGGDELDRVLVEAALDERAQERSPARAFPGRPPCALLLCQTHVKLHVRSLRFPTRDVTSLGSNVPL